MKDIFLAISIVLTLFSAVPYMRDIVRGRTRPNLVSWITWSLLTGIATAAAVDAGEIGTALFTGAATIETTLIVILGLRKGYVKYSRFDVVCQVGAIVGIIMWQLFDSPSIGVVSAVAIDFIGALPTIRHSWLKPLEETWITFAISGVAGAFAIASFDTYNLVTVPYALYILVINFILCWIIISRRKTYKGA